jgi:BASS family bile acid:Na+ symporter
VLALARLVPVIAAILLFAVGLDTTADDFRRVRHEPRLVLTGLLVPPVLLSALALGLVRLFHPAPAIAVGLLLVAMCPIGGISNTYSYLARASTALSVTLTGLSCLFGIVTIPAAGALFRIALGDTGGFEPPVMRATIQAIVVLGVPVAAGMLVRNRWPLWARARRPLLQKISVAGIAALLAAVIAQDAQGFARQLIGTASLAAAFILGSMLLGWSVGGLVARSSADRFTITAEFATRNLAVATAVAIGTLGRIEFALFAAIYFLTEAPLMLAAVAAFRHADAGTSGRP